ncbi:hypothetical protein E4U55_004403 [Claviceps digitariae]|nr:hypothetical protein E4U55_004403 [Claviceps digitariae]
MGDFIIIVIVSIDQYCFLSSNNRTDSGYEFALSFVEAVRSRRQPCGRFTLVAAGREHAPVTAAINAWLLRGGILDLLGDLIK